MKVTPARAFELLVFQTFGRSCGLEILFRGLLKAVDRAIVC